MKKTLTSLLLVIAVLCPALTGCAVPEQSRQYTATFLDLFDTVTTVVGKADSQAAFTKTAQDIHDRLMYYHQLFDIYKSYDGINNLKTVNDRAGRMPVQVDPEIIRMLLDCKRYYELTNGKVNAAMGSVLKLWHDARSNGIHDPDNARLPDADALSAAAEHMDFSNVLIDVERASVRFADPAVQLDVGAIAKGWAAQQVAEASPAGLLISVGGNVCATGPKDASGTPWVVGIQDPNGGSEYLQTICVTGGSVVTSGDYQRAYQVDGQLYHHIIDPQTRYPSRYWRSVTVVCRDSGLADALSTALFLLPREEGQILLDESGGEAMWVDSQGGIFYSPGFEKLIKP